MKRIAIISFIGILFVQSCFVNKLEESRLNNTKKLVLSSDKNYVSHKVDEAIEGDYGQYLNFFTPTDYQVGISSHIDGALSSVEKLAFYSGECPIKPLTRSFLRESPSLVSSIEGIELNQKSLEAPILTKGFEDSLHGAFGKIVTFSLRPAPVMETRSSGEESSEDDEEEFKMYIPQRIMVSAPVATCDEENNPLCYFGDFVVRWNADEQNANGVLIYVEWMGGMVLGDDIENTFVKRVVVVPDTGVATLEPTFFDGIPDTALCSLIVLRGAIENVQGENYSYKLLGESHQLISFILIRDIEPSC